MEISNSKLRVMNILWDRGDLTARDICAILKEQWGWNKNTTYTVINSCIKSGLLERRGNDFLCHALLPRTEVQSEELDSLMNRLFQGSPKLLFSTLVSNQNLTKDELSELKQLIETLEQE